MIVASPIETAKRNGVEPYGWLSGTLACMVEGYPNHRLDELVPWVEKVVGEYYF